MRARSGVIPCLSSRRSSFNRTGIEPTGRPGRSPAPVPTPLRPRVEDDRQSSLAVTHDDHLRVVRHREALRRLDALPLQQAVADTLRNGRLKVPDALRLDALALRLPLLPVQ